MAAGVAPEAVIVSVLTQYRSISRSVDLFRTDEFIKPLEATLLALALVLASGRLVPRCIQRMNPTASDIFLIISILNTIALFTTDVMTYKMGGMSDDDPPEETLAKLKKVRVDTRAHHLRKSARADCNHIGTICRQLLL